MGCHLSSAKQLFYSMLAESQFEVKDKMSMELESK